MGALAPQLPSWAGPCDAGFLLGAQGRQCMRSGACLKLAAQVSEVGLIERPALLRAGWRPDQHGGEGEAALGEAGAGRAGRWRCPEDRVFCTARAQPAWPALFTREQPRVSFARARCQVPAAQGHAEHAHVRAACLPVVSVSLLVSAGGRGQSQSVACVGALM